MHIYGQHEHHTLLQPETHLNLLDAFADLAAWPRTMKENFAGLADAWNATLRRRGRLSSSGVAKRACSKRKPRRSAQSRLKPGEEEELRASKNILAHAEKLHQGCREGEELLYEGDAALVGRLGKYAVRLRELVDHRSASAAERRIARLVAGATARGRGATAPLRRARPLRSARVGTSRRPAWRDSASQT